MYPLAWVILSVILFAVFSGVLVNFSLKFGIVSLLLTLGVLGIVLSAIFCFVRRRRRKAHRTSRTLDE